MTTPRALALGDWVAVDGEDHQIVGLAGTSVRLRSSRGRAQVVLASDLLRYGEARSVAPAQSARAAASSHDAAEPQLDRDALVDVLPAEELARVRALETHLREMMTGYPGGAPIDEEPPNPTYLPSIDITLRIKAKHAELASTPLKCGERSLWRYYENYRDFGAWGLVNKTKVRVRNPLAGLDARVQEAILEQAAIETDESTAGHHRFYRRVEQRLAVRYGADAPPLPLDRTFRRHTAALLGERFLSKPGDQRRNTARQTNGVHGHFYATRPGQVVMLDSTRLDVLAFDPVSGETLPLELTIALDLFTRSILAWRLTPLGANAVDAVMLIADMLTPEPMRPGWPEQLRYSYYGIHVERAYSLDARVREAAARPLIWPETIVVDNGRIFVSDAMRNGCLRYGISLQFARLEKPTDKPEVERAFGTIREQFASHMAGYKGRNVSHRGRKVESSARWTLDEVADFFAEYIVTIYQRRPHSGLHAPGDPALPMSPNDMYAEGVAVAGAIPMPSDSYPYLELLPVEWRQIHSYGVQLDHLIYDGKGLNGLRGTSSPYPNGLWPIRKDPRNRLQVFFKHPHSGTWHALKWVHAEDWLEPFSDRSIAYVLDELASRGRTHPLTDEVTAGLKDLQRRMDDPNAATAKDKRRLARDRARVQSTLRDQARAGYDTADQSELPALHVVADDADDTTTSAFDLSELRPFPVYGADEDATGAR